MTDIRAFRGFRYDVDKVRIDDVVAPPYDIISPVEAGRLRERSDHNILYVDLPDADDPRGYSRAAEVLESWRSSGVLKRDREPSLYLITDTFELEGRTYNRTGITAAVRLETFGSGSIYPHEGTLSGPKMDRFRLMATTRANLSSILAMYSDSDAAVHLVMQEYLNEPPLVRGIGPTGPFELRRITAPALILRIGKLFAERPLFIADGHHRYETALAYRNSPAGVGNYPAAFVMMHLVAVEDAAVKVLPTHRLICQGATPGLPKLLEALRKDFVVKELGGGVPALPGEDAPAGTFLLRGPGRTFEVTLKAEMGPGEIDAEASEEWCRLDVAVLQKRVLEPLLGITPEKLKSSDVVGYSHDLAEAVKSVDSGRFGVGFLMRATPVGSVAAVARNLEKMPPKSTYFYPKLLTGLVLRRLEQG